MTQRGLLLTWVGLQASGRVLLVVQLAAPTLHLGTTIATDHGWARGGQLGSGVTYVWWLSFRVTEGLPLLYPSFKSHPELSQQMTTSGPPVTDFCFLSFRA